MNDDKNKQETHNNKVDELIPFLQTAPKQLEEFLFRPEFWIRRYTNTF